MERTAQAAGPPPPVSDVNIADALRAVARRMPDKPAVICHRGGRRRAIGRSPACTFAALDRAADGVARLLALRGLGRGQKALVLIPPSPLLFAATFGLFRAGAIPVLIDPGMGLRNVARCLAPLACAGFIGVRRAHLLRWMFPSAFRSAQVAVTANQKLWQAALAAGTTEFPGARTRADDPAAILFTSGSTGPAKGVVYEHGMFAAQVRYLQTHYGYGETDIDLATFPLFALFDAALGVTAVIPQMNASRPGSADPRRIVAAIRDEGCTQMFGSPALLTNLAEHAFDANVKLPRLRRVITAGAPVRSDLLTKLRLVLDTQSAVHTPYGATEALPVADIESREILEETQRATAAGAGTCVGRPLAGVSVRIIEISDNPLADWGVARELAAGEVGEIVAQGPAVTKEYFGNNAATQAAKIRAADGAVWHRMGDVGYFDRLGRLWFCGRKSQRVETADGPLYTECCEAIFNQHPAVRRAALVGVRTGGETRPVICVELRNRGIRTTKTQRHEEGQGSGSRKWGAIDGLIEELLEMAGASAVTRGIRTVLIYPRPFPVDPRHNAKIVREKLAVWAARELNR